MPEEPMPPGDALRASAGPGAAPEVGAGSRSAAEAGAAPGSLAELRAAIDRLDDRIVPLLVARSRHVLAAAGFKRSAAEVQAPQRAAEVVAKARCRAEAAGASAAVVAVIERVYRELIAAGTEAELAQWRRPPPATAGPDESRPPHAGDRS